MPDLSVKMISAFLSSISSILSYQLLARSDVSIGDAPNDLFSTIYIYYLLFSASYAFASSATCANGSTFSTSSMFGSGAYSVVKFPKEF